MKKLFLLIFVFILASPALADAASKIRQVNATPDKQELFLQRSQKNETKYEKNAVNKKFVQKQSLSTKGTSNFTYDDENIRNGNFYRSLDSNLNYSKQSDAYSEGK